ncbi:MAG: rhamnan synthesis F family protein, partial [Desulfovibrio sp.]|nr:rhamnan synthesis F family protein [Desulfovibrio sp.]
MGTTAVASAPTSKSRRGRPRRLLLFVHYNKWGELADYVVYLLKRIRKVYARMVFISNSPLTEEARAVLSALCDEVVERENTGFDFYAWKVALDREGPEGLARYDSVTLMNDTCFGPLFDLEAVYRKMEAQGADFWGLTNHREKVGEDLLATDGCIPEHIQSYFLCFKKETALSEPFTKFWRNVAPETDVVACIKKYETQLTRYFSTLGFTPAVYCDVAGGDLAVSNVTTQDPAY